VLAGGAGGVTMAHADTINDNLNLYQRMMKNNEHWMGCVNKLMVDKETLYGRICLSQQVRFRVAIKLINKGYIEAWIWRENPKDKDEMLTIDPMVLTLCGLIESFPEIKEIELFDSWDELEETL